MVTGSVLPRARAISGVVTIAHAAPQFAEGKVVGAWLAAPADLEARAPIEELLKEGGDDVAIPQGFDPVPRDPLPFPSLVVAGSNDPYCAYGKAAEMARAWGAELVNAGEAGHLNAASGYGPWPDGVMRLAVFLRGL